MASHHPIETTKPTPMKPAAISNWFTPMTFIPFLNLKLIINLGTGPTYIWYRSHHFSTVWYRTIGTVYFCTVWFRPTNGSYFFPTIVSGQYFVRQKSIALCQHTSRFMTLSRQYQLQPTASHAPCAPSPKRLAGPRRSGVPVAACP